MKIRGGHVLVVMLLLAFSLVAGSPAASTASAAASPQTASGPISPIGNVFQIANQQVHLESRPDVAYNSIDQEYLAVWHEDGPYATIWGQRISKYGSLIGPAFQIANQGQTTDRRYPRLAFNSRSNEYLVVWLQSESDQGTICICGRYLTGSGSVINSDDTVIVNAKASDDTYSIPVVGYAHTSNQYMVVWVDDNHPGGSTNLSFVYGRAVIQGWMGQLKLIEGPYGVGGFSKSVPEIAYNSLVDQFMVVWQQINYGDTISTDIQALIITPDGNPVTSEKTIAHYDHDCAAPVVAALPIPPYGQYLAAWESHYAANDSDIQARIFSPFGDPLTNEFSISNNLGVDETQPAIAASGTRSQYLVTWRQATILTWGLTGGRIATPSGSVAGDPINLGGWIDGHSRTTAGWSGDFLTVYDDTPFTPDIGVYGMLTGNRIYLPVTKK